MSSADPDGPYAVVNQLEFPLEGVEPLSTEQRVQAWLDEHDDANAKSAYAARLFIDDRRSREARAARWRRVSSIQDPYYRESGWLTPGGSEAVWLYDEAVAAFVAGLPLASLLCAHAACERVLAGCLLGYEAELPSSWIRWGLGNLVVAAFERGLIDSDLRTELLAINETRKVSAHYKPPGTENSIPTRTHARLKSQFIFPDEIVDWDAALDHVAFDDATAGLRVSTALILGGQAFVRAKW